MAGGASALSSERVALQDRIRLYCTSFVITLARSVLWFALELSPGLPDV